MSKLFFDVTYLAHWPGNLTGITRVIHELALRYAKEPDCVFVIWDNQSQQFYEADINSVILNHGVRIEYLTNDATPQSQAGDTFPIKVTRRLARYKVPAAARAHGTLAKRYHANFRRMQAKAGDTFFIPMGEWAIVAYTEMVVRFAAEGIKVVQVINDMLPLIAPQYSGHSTEIMNRYCKAILPVSNRILVISKHTERDVRTWMEQHHFEVPPIGVYRLGEDFTISDPHKPTDHAFTDSGLVGDDFVLCVGTMEARKNHTLLYYAYKLAKQRGVELPKLIIAGRRGWRTDDVYNLITTDPETKDQFVVLTDVNDNVLSWLYNNCLFSVYPSFYEGWGIPIAESLVRGAPCLSSNTSSMPEVAGDKVDYFSPVSTDECLAAMQKLLDPQYLQKARAETKKFKPTSWDETFVQVNGLIRDTLGK